MLKKRMNSGNKNLHAALLAGGRSERMGSDKCLLDWRGISLWQHQLETLIDLHPGQIHVAAPSRPEWLPSDVQWCKDTIENAGPIGGLHAALLAAQPAMLAVLAIDLPNITTAYLRALLSQCDGGMGCVPMSENGFEPLTAVYPSDLAGSASAWMSNGNRSLQDWLKQLCAKGQMQSVPVTSEQNALFLNLNHPSDLIAS